MSRRENIATCTLRAVPLSKTIQSIPVDMMKRVYLQRKPKDVVIQKQILINGWEILAILYTRIRECYQMLVVYMGKERPHPQDIPKPKDIGFIAASG